MPGPRSAPNGKYDLTTRIGDSGPNIVTGKTQVKRGTMKRKAAVDEERRMSDAAKDHLYN